MKPMAALNEKINAARFVLDNLNTTEDFVRNGLNENRSEKQGIRYLIDDLRNGEETHTACVNIKNFFDRFGIETEERSHNRFFIKPKIKGVQAFENEPWYAELCLLIDEGYCVSKKEYKYLIFDACEKLSLTVSFRQYFGSDYFVICGEYDHYTLKRYDCLAYFFEKAKSELTEYSQDCTWKAPKPGFFKEWAAAAFRYERLRQMLDEIYHHHHDFEGIIKIYVGTIGSYGFDVTKTSDPHSFISHVNFNVGFTADAWKTSCCGILFAAPEGGESDGEICNYFHTQRKIFDSGDVQIFRGVKKRLL